MKGLATASPMSSGAELKIDQKREPWCRILPAPARGGSLGRSMTLLDVIDRAYGSASIVQAPMRPIVLARPYAGSGAFPHRGLLRKAGNLAGREQDQPLGYRSRAASSAPHFSAEGARLWLKPGPTQ